MRLLSIAAVIASASTALAQPAPAPQPPPADPAAPPPGQTPPEEQTAADGQTPAEGQPPPIPPTPAETAPAVTAPPAPVPTLEPTKIEKKKDEKPALSAVYDGGMKVSTADGKFSLKFSFRAQLRFEANRSLDDTMPNGQASQFQDRFYIPRDRLVITGNIFGKSTRYKLQFQLGDQGTYGFTRDVFIERRLGSSPAWLRAGQWKRPFNRAQLVGNFVSTFNERSIQDTLAGGGRDQGIAVHNDYETSPEGIEWVAGVFNRLNGGSDTPRYSTTCSTNAMTGNTTCVDGTPSTTPTDFGPAFVARVAYNSAKIKGYSEGDLEGGPLRYSVGLAYKVDLANFAKNAQDTWVDNMTNGLEGDVMLKAHGFGFHAGAVLMKVKTANAQYGVYAQPSLSLDKHNEVAARFAWVSGTIVGATVAERDMIEARLAYNYLFKGHTYELMNDAGFTKRLGDDAMGNTDKADLQFRVMLQLSL